MQQLQLQSGTTVTQQEFFILVFSLFKMLEERNVKFYMNSKVTEIRGENGKVTSPLFHEKCL